MDGRSFERKFAEMIGGEVVPASGAGKWAKLDVNGLQIVWSCKHTIHGSRAILPVEFQEVERAVRGPGGYGGDVIPGMAIGIGDNFSIVCMETQYFLDFVSRDAPTVISTSAQTRRSHSSTTPLMRSLEEDL